MNIELPKKPKKVKTPDAPDAPAKMKRTRRPRDQANAYAFATNAINPELGALLRAAAAYRKMGAQEATAYFGVNRFTWDRVAQGRSNPRINQIRKYDEFIGLSTIGACENIKSLAAHASDDPEHYARVLAVNAWLLVSDALGCLSGS